MGVNKKQGTGGIYLDNLLKPTLLLLIYQKPAHGYELMQNLSDFDPAREIEPATIYRNLRRMEGEGLVTSKWKTSAHGPARRQYHITGRGISALHEMSAQLVRLKGQIESFLSRYKALKGENISE